MFGFKRLTGLAVLTALLAACGSLPRPEGPLRIAPHQIMPVADPRIRSTDTVKIRAMADTFTERMARGDHHDVLSLSGGGAGGAYGAGVMVGWTEHGDRPEFDVVSGVSTGALIAPFAFLGPEWDDELTAAYTDGQASNLLNPRVLSILAAPSLFSSDGLRALVDRNVTPEMLTAIAAEYAKGRQLLVATTNLDTEETVIWDMGLLASQGPQAVELFKQVLVASASIPGVFTPQLIAGLNPDGEVVLEMHADGGVNTPFLAVPEGALLWTAPEAQDGRAAIYVIVNGQLGANTGVTPGRLAGILARAYDSMSKATARQALVANSAFTMRNGMALVVTSIPDNANVSSLNFGQAEMTALFNVGRARAASGQAWTSVTASSQAGLPETYVVPDADLPDILRPRSRKADR